MGRRTVLSVVFLVCVGVAVTGCTRKTPAPGPAGAGAAAPAAPSEGAVRAGDALKDSGGYRVQAAADPSQLGKLEVTAVYTTEPAPVQTELPVNIDIEYCSHKVKTEDLVVDASTGGLQNVVVQLEGITAGPKPIPDTLLIANRGCSFVPHVAVAVKGQKLELANDDEILHTTHPYLNGRHFFNTSLKAGERPKRARPIPQPGLMRIDCDVHKWMRAYVVVHTSPYIGVTDAKGTLTIDEIPPGEYSYTVWHEQFDAQQQSVGVAGGKTGKVVVAAGEAASLKLEFSKQEE